MPPLPDGCFATVDVEVAAAPLVEVIRSFRRTSRRPMTRMAAIRTRTTSCVTRSRLRPSTQRRTPRLPGAGSRVVAKLLPVRVSPGADCRFGPGHD